MRQKEQRLWDTFRRHLKESRPPVWAQRMENVAGSGMADVVIHTSVGNVRWVELKAPTLPKRPTTPVLGDEGLSIAQRNWHLKAWSMNVRTYVLVRLGDVPYLVPGVFAADINNWPRGQYDQPGHAIIRGWDEIIEALNK